MDSLSKKSRACPFNKIRVIYKAKHVCEMEVPRTVKKKPRTEPSPESEPESEPENPFAEFLVSDNKREIRETIFKNVLKDAHELPMLVFVDRWITREFNKRVAMFMDTWRIYFDVSRRDELDVWKLPATTIENMSREDANDLIREGILLTNRKDAYITTYIRCWQQNYVMHGRNSSDDTMWITGDLSNIYPNWEQRLNDHRTINTIPPWLRYWKLIAICGAALIAYEGLRADNQWTDYLSHNPNGLIRTVEIRRGFFETCADGRRVMVRTSAGTSAGASKNDSENVDGGGGGSSNKRKRFRDFPYLRF